MFVPAKAATRLPEDVLRTRSRRLACAALAMGLGTASQAHAGDLGEIDTGPASLELGGPYLLAGQDLAFAAALDWHFRRKTQDIRRAYVCLTGETIGGASLCATGSGVGYADDLRAETIRSTLDLKLAVAFFRLVELRLRAPIVLTETTHVRFDDGVDAQSSRTAPYNADPIFAVPNTSPTRAGLADPTIGLWATFVSTQRDPDDATVALGVDVTLPLASARKAGHATVGDGAVDIDIALGASGRVLPWLVPFGRLDIVVRVPGSDTLYPDLGSTQQVSGPPHSLAWTFGATFVPFEDAPSRAVRLTLGGRIEFLSAGKFPTALFDAIGTSDCDPNDLQNPCALTTTASGLRASGATIVEEHLAFQGWVGADYDLLGALRLSARASVAWETPHNLTFSDRGIDLDGQLGLQPFNAIGRNEFDPDYNPAWDAPGNRFRSVGAVTLGLDVSVSGHF